MTVLIISTIIYVAVLMAFAAFFYRKIHTQNEFCIGARGLGSRQIGFSGQLSELGVFFLVLIPSYVYLNGMGGAWIVVGLFIGTLISWYFMSYRLMRYSLKYKNVYSLPAYLGRRFGKRTEKLQMSAAVLSIITELLITVMLVRLLGLLVADVFEVDMRFVTTAVIITAALFTALGGYLAAGKVSIVSITLMFAAFAAIFTVCILVFSADELIVSVMNSRVTGGVSKYLDLLHYKGESITVRQVYNQLSWGLVVMGLPGLLTKFLTLDKARTAKHGGRTAFLFTLITLFLSVVAGVVLRAFMYPAILKKHNYFMLISRTVRKLCMMKLGYKIAAGVILAGLSASLMTMIISRLINLCTVIYCEVVKTVILKKKRIKKNMLMLRITLGVTAVVILLLSLINVDPFEYIEKLIALSAIAFGPVTFLSIYYRRMNKQGALFGMLSGPAAALFWNYVKIIKKNGEFLTLRDYLGINPVVAAMLISVIVTVVVSRLSKDVTEEVKSDFNEVKNRIIT